ncbi:metallo-beta-lactamase domain-containing protein 1-like [Ostrea edulis]|uniref:metallo-beta-lactamase domain-containing protein 1-like n=1 Tax=Ostrea edulis TaxID=37623 RepID=UPI0020956306|nr:metallo-beta-lactamase domain-containing protein 1-like [Ostrea edulis]XP_048747317.1 metallo-beta-lactamase domain-containing protein 1-like [Ostrea edulis]XP_048747318.1 metallo-beta-lactamase domain-containing protein 1-like [Ostrea edulis]
MPYEVIVLKEGYSKAEGPGQQRACGSISLIKGPKNIIVDTGNPWDRDNILNGLKQNGLSPENIQYCVCTHGHSDHVGNLNLFCNAVHILSYDICIGDQYQMHDFKMGIPYEIDDDVEVVPTPGHTGTDISVIVSNTDLGTVAVTGDLFECLEDLEEPSLWQDNSENPEIQEQQRIEVLRKADYIVPGHGKMFKVPDEYKRSSMKVVMFREEVYEVGGQKTTLCEYVEIEDSQ